MVITSPLWSDKLGLILLIQKNVGSISVRILSTRFTMSCNPGIVFDGDYQVEGTE